MYLLAAVAAVLIILLVVSTTTSAPLASPAQLAAFHILIAIKALSAAKCGGSVCVAARRMGGLFGSEMPTLAEARIIHETFHPSIPALETVRSSLRTGADQLAEKNCTGDLVGWMRQAAASIDSIIGLLHILGDNL